MKRRHFLGRTLAMTGLALVALAACTREEPAFGVGIHPWIGYESLYLAREFGWLPKNIVLHDGKNATDSLEGLKSGKLDAAALTLDETLRARAEGIPLKIVAVFDISAGADMLLARPGIRTLADLRGRCIAAESSAVGTLALAKALHAGGLNKDAVTVLDIPPDKQLAAWQSGQIDAAVTYEPTASYLMRLGAVPLFDSRRIPESIFDVLVIRDDRTKGSDETVRRLVEAHFLGLDHIRINRQDALYRIAARQNISHDEAERALAGVILPNLDGNRRYLAEDSRLMEVARTTHALMVDSGLLHAPDQLKNLIDRGYLPTGGPTP